MNFVGKFDAKLHVDGSGAHPDVHHHVDSISAHAPSDAIIVPDADLLFNGDFRRSGVDLILSRDDREWAVEDYFKGEKRVALASPDGAHLTGDIINALAGHVQYAQADGSAGAGKVIGHVTKLTGTATAIRNGVSIILNHGDNVEKGDVVQSGSGSTLGVTFIDGTVFGLSANARMVLNEMIYDPNGSDNSTLISLVSGTISFVAGQTAKHGDMKIDTPVATMGIRGTAVLVEIDFDVPGQNGMPEGRFQVVMEPNGILGSYILYEKNTLAPIAIVDKAGQRVDVSNNHVSFSDLPLTPELQKLISEVFTLKFSTNPQTFTHFTDTLIPQETWLPVQFANGAPPVAVHVTIAPFVLLSASSSSAPAGGSPIPHINQPPVVITADSSLAEHAGVTGSSGIDTTSGTISFADINLGDRPTAKATISSFSYQNAQHQDISASAQELADIQALENIPLVVVQAPGNTYNGTATWTLNVPDKAFDFLGAGDTLRLTYMAEVDSNYGGGNLPGFAPFTITVTGTNDAPVITTGPEKVAFVSVGTGTTGPSLPPTGPTSNKLTFKDPDLTDTHTVSTHLTAATLSGNGVATLDMQALETKFPRPMGVFESALSAAVTTDSSGTGTGTITWTLADISAYYADIVPVGETLKLTYAVTVKDSQGATSSQNVIVTITGSDAPAVVWVETTADALTDPAPGDWNGAHNWETGTVPTKNDDVIIITNQLQGQTPFYPVTIKAVADGGVAAVAHSLTMNDYGTLFTNSPTLINQGTLTVGAGGISLSADAILKNFGTLSVGGLAEILQQASLQNSGLITLAQGGDFLGTSSITNSGTIEVVGGTLNVDVAVANSGGVIQIDHGATLKLNGAAIDGGTISDNNLIDVTVASTIAGSSTTDANLNGNGTGTVQLDAALTLDYVKLNGITLENGLLTIKDTVEVAGAVTLLNDTVTNTDATLQVDDGQTLKLNGTTINGGTINDFSSTAGGKIDVTVASTIAGSSTTDANLNGNGTGTVQLDAALTLDYVKLNGITLENGLLTIKDTVEVAGAVTLLNDTVTNTGATLQVDDGQTLKLSGTTINNGTINDFSSTAGGTIDVTGASTIAGSSTTDANLNGNGTGTVQLDAALTLDYVKLNGITLENGPLTIKDTVEVAGAVTLFNDTVTNTGATLQVDDGQTLKLSGTTINNGTINDFSSTAGGTIDVTGASTIAGSSTTDANLNGNGTGSTVQLDAALTLDYVKLNGITLENGPLTIKDTVEVAGAVTLFNDTVTNTDATLQVDDGQTLKLNGTTINNGTINDFSSTAGGTIDVTGASTIAGSSTAAEANLNGAGAGSTVQLDAALTLDYVKFNGITLENGPLTIKDTVEVAGAVTLLNDTVTNTGATLQVDDGQTLKLSGTEIIGGIINDFSGPLGGKIDVTGDSKIDSGATLNNGAVTVESDVTLTLDNVTVNGTVFNDLVTGGTIQIDSGDALTFNGATINGGTLNISGELDSTGTSFITGATIVNSSHIDVVSGTLTIDPTPVTNTGTIEVKGDSILVLSDEIITNTDGTTKGIIQVDADPTHTAATLDLEGSTINGGTLIISGELVSTGDSFITGTDITNTGTIDVTSGTLTIDATSILNNTGTLESNGGNLIIDTAFAGSLEIKGAAALELGSADAYSHVTVTFEPEATGTLKLDHSEAFSGTVAGLDDNTIDLVDIAYGSNPTVSYAGDASGGILSVFVNGVDVSNIKLTGDYLGVHWTLTDDGSSPHGTDVMEAPGAVAGLDSNGNAIQGVAVTASITDGGQTVSGATYDWQVSHDGGKTWVDAHGTNGLSSYTPVEADEGQLLRVALSFTDYSGQPETSFVSAGVVQESLTDDLVATLDHTTAQQGVTMHVLGVKDGGITVTTGLTYAWQDSSDNGLTWVTVGNGTHSSYTPGESDEGKLMQLVVTYADASGSESSTYSLGMPNDLSATLDSTTAQQGLAIHVTAVNDGGTKVSSGVSYAWQVSSDNGTDWITVGTHSSYTPIAADAGETLQVVVTYADSQEKESATYSLGSVAPAKEWLGGNHDWQTAGQWATSGAPASSDNAVIDASGFYTVKIDQAAAAHSLVVNDLGAAVEILAGNTLTLGGNATIEAGILQIDSGATLKDIAASATITGAFIDNGTVEAAGGTLEVASAISFGAGKFTIDAGATLQLDHADTLKVAFSGNGELILKDPTHFTGIISDSGGSLTSADVVDVAGFDTGASVSYFGLKSGGIVTISETGHTAVNLIVGANSTHWSAPVTDGHGGILIHDPPADTSGQALDSVVITDPGPAATSTIVASGPNQILTGNAASDTFAFNFIGVGHTTVTDFHPATDTLQFSNQLFADLQAALNATHDDGHGNTVVALDAHDTITLNGILKAQLHASDFHFV